MHGIEEDYPPEAFYAMMNLVGSHDVNRVLIPLDQDGDPTDADYSDGKMRQKMLGDHPDDDARRAHHLLRRRSRPW